nr:hypothetical protein [Micromonospora sp. DSM 115978]
MTFESEAKQSYVHLRFVFDDFDPVLGALRGYVSANLDMERYRNRYFSNELPSSISLRLGSVHSQKLYELPLLTSSKTDSASVPLELETWGDPRSFPSDTYAAIYLLGLGNGLGFPSVSAVMGSGLSQYAIKASVNGVYLNFLFERPALQAGWVYLIASSPFVLLLVLVWSGLRSQQNAAVSAIETAVGLLALLPLRQVLVPAHLEMITNVDLLLGLELVLFIGWMAVLVALKDRPRTSTSSSQGDGEIVA